MAEITDVSKYFRKEGGKQIFIGKKLEILIPEVYRDRKFFEIIGDKAVSLGIVKLRFNDIDTAILMIISKISFGYSNISNIEENGESYICLTLNRDDVFIHEINIVKNSNIAYDLFMSFIALGKIPKFISYDKISKLFDNDIKCSGINLNINHAIFEMIYAHMYRDSADPFTFYRYTRMNKMPVIVPLHQISHGPVSTSARIIGSYMKEGMVSSLVDDSDKEPSLIENLLRV